MSGLVRNIAVLILLILFVGPVIGLGVNALRATSGVSETEKRRLAELPDFTGDLRAYTGEFDTYLEDNFGFRMALIRFARDLRDNLGENPPNVVFGRDDWLFIGNTTYRDEFEGQGPWTERQVDQWISDLTTLNQALAVQDIPFAAVIALDKARVFPEKLPRDWRESDRRFRSRLHTHSDVSETGLIDAEPYIQTAKANGVKVFYARDTHWTLDGTVSLSRAIMDQFDPQNTRPRFQPDPPRLHPHRRLLDLEGMAGYSETQEPNTPMIDGPPSQEGFLKIRTASSQAASQQGQFATWDIDGAPDAPAGRLVIVGDSFGDAVLEHLRASYADIIRLHHGAHIFDVTFAEIIAEEPDAVLFITAERQAVKKRRPVNVDSAN